MEIICNVQEAVYFSPEDVIKMGYFNSELSNSLFVRFKACWCALFGTSQLLYKIAWADFVVQEITRLIWWTDCLWPWKA